MFEKYEFIESINDEHKVYLVKNIQDGCYYVKKVLDIYDKNIYELLLNNHFVGIPQVVEISEDNGQLTVFEKFISGKNLDEILNEERSFFDYEVKEIIIEICQILKQLNKIAPVVHRDIKPSNIIINNDGPYLIDFNTAKFVDKNKSRDTVLLGTEGYAAPEQYGFASSNMQTDIYALGILMKELATRNTSRLLSKDLENIISRCTRLDPKDRFSNYDELIEALAPTNKQKKNTNHHKYALVGFRSDKLYIKIFASLWYLAIVYVGFTMNVDNTTGAMLFFDRLGCSLAFIAMTLFGGNYLNIHEKLSLTKTNKVVRVILVVIVDYLLGVAIIFATLLIQTLIESIISLV